MSNRLLNRTINSPFIGEQLRSSTHSHKLSTMFLTQKRSQPHENEILQRHSELNTYIDKLDGKIKKIVENNQAELLFAYKNHLQHVKEQMKGFKEQTMARMQSEADQKDKIQILEKKLIVFREEALKLFEKAMKKDKLIEQLNMKLDEYQSQREFMNETVKSLLKRNKQLEALMKMEQLQQKRLREKTIQEDYLGKISVNSFVSLGISSHKKILNRDRKIKDRVMTTINNSKLFTQSQFKSSSPSKLVYTQMEENQKTDVENFAQRLKIKLAYIDQNLLENIVEGASEVYTFLDEKSKHLRTMCTKESEVIKKIGSSLRSRSFHTCQSSSKFKNSLSKYSHTNSIQIPEENKLDAELKDCFRKCVEVVKKQVCRRRKINTINFFKQGSPITLQYFKKMDFMKLLELLFSHERIIQILYNSLFNLPF